MDSSCSDLEFFDLSNASEDEVKEIQEILRLPKGNCYVELPWEITLAEECEASSDKPGEQEEKPSDSELSESPKATGAVVGDALVYALQQPTPPPPLPSSLQNPDILPVEAFVPPPSGVQLPTATTVGHYPNPSYFIPRTLPYLRAYPPMGMPLFTCAVPSSGDMRDVSHMQPPYGHIIPLTAAVPHMDKPAESKGDNEARQKARASLDRQFNRRNKKKHLPSSNFYNTSDIGNAVDAYQETVMTEDQMSVSLQGPIEVSGDHLTSVTSSVPLVPLPVPPSTFAVTSGAIPLHGYPPGLHTLPYSHISGPQAPSAPVYYVPVFNHPPYASYIPSPSSGPLMVPMGVGNIHPVNESSCTSEEPITTDHCVENSESAAFSSESVAKPNENSQNLELDSEISAAEKQRNGDCKEDRQKDTLKKNITADANDSVTEYCSQENTDTLTESISDLNIKDNDCSEEHSKGEESHDMYPDGSSRCWADLFKKQCTSEVNGLDQQSVGTSDCESTNEHNNINKDITNGKLYTVPASEDIL